MFGPIQRITQKCKNVLSLYYLQFKLMKYLSFINLIPINYKYNKPLLATFWHLSFKFWLLIFDLYFPGILAYPVISLKFDKLSFLRKNNSLKFGFIQVAGCSDWFEIPLLIDFIVRMEVKCN